MAQVWTRKGGAGSSSVSASAPTHGAEEATSRTVFRFSPYVASIGIVLVLSVVLFSWGVFSDESRKNRGGENRRSVRVFFAPLLWSFAAVCVRTLHWVLEDVKKNTRGRARGGVGNDTGALAALGLVALFVSRPVSILLVAIVALHGVDGEAASVVCIVIGAALLVSETAADIQFFGGDYALVASQETSADAQAKREAKGRKERTVFTASIAVAWITWVGLALTAHLGTGCNVDDLMLGASLGSVVFKVASDVARAMDRFSPRDLTASCAWLDSVSMVVLLFGMCGAFC